MKQKLFLLLLQAFLAQGINAEVVTGFCGPSVKFNLDTTTGVLKIEGSGNMNDYRWSYREPDWFYYREYVKTVEISNTVTSIGNSAFHDLSTLTSVTIPSSIRFIGEDAFSYCSALTSITIPNSVTSIGERAFEGSGLISVTIPNSITYIKGGVFSRCTSLTTITIPNSVTGIGYFAFGCCSALASVEIPSGVTTIDREAFSHDTALSSLYIPNTVTNIWEGAFSGCSALTSIAIPNSVTTISSCAFADCKNLKELVLGEGLRHIGAGAFSDSSIETIYSCSPIPPSCNSGDPFSSDTYEMALLYVPNDQDAIQKYKASDPWRLFSNIKEYDFTGITATPSPNAAPASIYDLSGKKLNESTKGINVVGNKKILVR